MKTMWNIVAALAVVNLLALGGFFLWLQATHRIDKARVQATKERFSKTLEEEAAEKATKEAEEKEAAAKAAEAAKLARPPTSATEMQVLLRQQQELENLRTSLMAQLGKLEDREKKLDTDKKAFADERKRIAEMEGSKQFQLALGTLEGQKAKDAKDVLKAMLDQKQEEQVVAYLA